MDVVANHDLFMRRCHTLALLGLGHVAPNPLVGCVIVKNGEIVGEGYHHQYGHRHAEVDAISSVKDQSQLIGATLYVNLEPCNHHGKTPPCTEAIIAAGISKVMVGNVDPNPLVAGSGIDFLKNNGLEVTSGILERHGMFLNRRFFTFHTKKRPYVILKWANSNDGFMAPDESVRQKNRQPYWISNEKSRFMVQKWRGEEQAIMVGKKTVESDDPALTCRYPNGKNPIRIIIDPKLSLSKEYKVFSNHDKVIVLNQKYNSLKGNCQYLIFEHRNAQSILSALYHVGIQSVLVEGGSNTLSFFLLENLWDECRVFTGKGNLGAGIKAPNLHLEKSESLDIEGDELDIYVNKKAN
ncbi:MAG: bifunctional diaminohydroxyphosphoribosylaminopyrimidine deaminase/5-amino-6-(5-phosphoribosylamino)uracil reductase RibD [Bacteroidota bacterium]